MKLSFVLLAAVAASYDYDSSSSPSTDDDGSSSSSSASTSSSGGVGDCNACQFIEGFVQGYAAGQMTCGSELTDFENGADDILSGLQSMVGSSPPSSSGWSSISSGFSEIESGLGSCAEESWWDDMTSDVESVFEDLVPEVKLVADAYEIVVNGVDIYDDLKSAYSDCDGGEWESCGSDMGSLVSTLKSSGVLIATQESQPSSSTSSVVPAVVGSACGLVALAGLAYGAQKYRQHTTRSENMKSMSVILEEDMDYARL